MMKKLFFFFFFLPGIIHAQGHLKKFDSLKFLVAKMPDDSNRIKSMIKLAKEANYVNADSALVWDNKGLELSFRLKDKRGIAAFSSMLGNYYLEHGDQEKSLKYSIDALKIYDALHDRKNAARVNMNCGNIFYDLHNFNNAIKYHEIARILYDSLKVDKGVADCDMNLANDYFGLGDTTRAILLYEQSLTIRRAINDRIGIAQTLNNLGETYSDLLQLDKARTYFSEAIQIKKEENDYFGLANTYSAMSQLEFRRNNFSEAIKQAKLSIEMCDRSHNPRVKKESLLILAECYAMQGNFKMAYAYQRAGSRLKDSLFSDESNSNIAEMQTKYETDKKEKENELLRQHNQIQQLASGKKDAEISKQRSVIIFAISGIVLLLALAIFIFKGYSDKRKAHHIISLQKKEVERQKELVEEKQKGIVDSITYAKRIQRALLASSGLLRKNLPDHFLLYKPKDIVSGDFYWGAEISNGTFLLLTGDCTGHGVPGAFMSLLNISLLNEIVIENRIEKPDDVLNEIRRAIIHALNPEGTDNVSWDGMDCSLINFDFPRMKMTFACANNPIWINRKGNLMEFLPDKFPVGKYEGDPGSFRIQSVDLHKGDVIYAFTDGFADQFGGPKGKKFKYSQLKEKLIAIGNENLGQQKNILEKTFDDWKGNLEQVDDVLVIGIKI